MKAIVTTPPYSPFLGEVVDHPIVEGIRLNTVMPIKGSLEETLLSIKETIGDKDLWIDLKGRQLRIKDYAVPPFTEIRLSHKIKVRTPVTAYFSGGEEYGKVLAVEENRLIMQDGPARVLGPGESVNIIDPSLEIEGYLTDTDKNYIEVCQKLGLNKYMLSFVESQEDIDNFKKLCPNTEIIAKIESKKGLDYITNNYKKDCTLMAARGDLFIEVGKPHNILEAMQLIIKKDKKAIVASRILDSLYRSLTPSCQDIGDIDSLLRMGYKTFMFGDEICFKRDSIMSGLNLLDAIIQNYKEK